MDLTRWLLWRRPIWSLEWLNPDQVKTAINLVLQSGDIYPIPMVCSSPYPNIFDQTAELICNNSLKVLWIGYLKNLRKDSQLLFSLVYIHLFSSNKKKTSINL